MLLLTGFSTDFINRKSKCSSISDALLFLRCCDVMGKPRGRKGEPKRKNDSLQWPKNLFVRHHSRTSIDGRHLCKDLAVQVH